MSYEAPDLYDGTPLRRALPEAVRIQIEAAVLEGADFEELSSFGRETLEAYFSSPDAIAPGEQYAA